MKNLKLILLVMALSFVVMYIPLLDAQTFPMPDRLSPYDIAEWTLRCGFIASGTVEPTAVANEGQLYWNNATPTAPVLWIMHDNLWRKGTSSYASGTIPHDSLVGLDYDASGHTGFARDTDIPNNASFTIAGLGSKEWSSLDGAPTNASYTLLLLSEHSFNSLTDKPTSADYTLLGLGEKNWSSLDGAPTNASYTLAGLSEQDFNNLTNKPTSASYTLLGLSEHSFNSLTDKPTSADYTLNGLGEKNFSSLANKPTTLSGYGITDGALDSDLEAHMDNTVNPHGASMTLGVGDGIGGVGYFASDTVFIKYFAYLPYQAIATTVGVGIYGVTFWADDTAKVVKMYLNAAWHTIVTMDSNGKTIVDVLNLTPGSAPSTPVEGDIYANSTDHHLYFYNGSAWVQLDN